jgi:CDP-glycerol glycerophosphotransferase (TagB/SpsB family)
MGELLKLKRWQVVVKPHPALKQDEVEYLKKFDLLVSDFDTTSLIPICDLFNTSVSSTIRWALACGKPVLNFDVFKYRYRDFVSEPAVIHAYSCEEFSAELNRLTTSKDALKRCKIDAEAAAPNWGLLDGGSTERIMRLFARLTNQSFADR